MGGKCVILNKTNDPVTGQPDINFSSVSDLKVFYENTTIPVEKNGRLIEFTYAEYWLGSPHRRDYKGLVFEPGKDIHGYYNLWQGFAVKPVQGSWELMKKHIFNIICKGDREVFSYIMAWKARLVQDPGGKRPGVVIVLRGKQGTGKGIFVVNFGKIFGSHFKHIISPHLVAGRFNSHFKDALLLFIDEGFWGGDKQSEGILKGIITEDSIVVEPKGKEPFVIRNHANFFFASNNEWVVPASTEERRFFVLDVSDERMGDTDYFKTIHEEMESGGREAMLYDLLHHDISGIDFRKFPRREALLDQITQTWPSEKKFWFELLRAGTIGISFSSNWPDTYECKRLYELYTEFAANMGDRFKVADRVFGKKIRELCPGIERKQSGDGKWNYRLPSLERCRADLEGLLKIKINWNE